MVELLIKPTFETIALIYAVAVKVFFRSLHKTNEVVVRDEHGPFFCVFDSTINFCFHFGMNCFYLQYQNKQKSDLL